MKTTDKNSPHNNSLSYHEHFIDNNQDIFSSDAAEGYSAVPGSKKSLWKLQTKLKILLLKTFWLALSLPVKIFTVSTCIAAASTTIYFSTQLHDSPDSKSTLYQNGHTSNKEKNILILDNQNNEIIDDFQKCEGESTTLHYSETEVIKPIQIIKNEQLDYFPIQNTQDLKYSSFPVRYIGKIKIVDFSKVYSTGFEYSNYSHSGVEAQFENNNEKHFQMSEMKFETVEYLEFISGIAQCIEFNNLLQAELMLNELFTVYPADENALFFKGLILHRKNEYEKSLIWFDRCIHSRYKAFYDESIWYRALSLFALERYSESRILLNQIILRNNEFKQEAENLILQINNNTLP